MLLELLQPMFLESVVILMVDILGLDAFMFRLSARFHSIVGRLEMVAQSAKKTRMARTRDMPMKKA